MPRPTLLENRCFGVDVNISNIFLNPHCKHGPTVLFERRLCTGETKKYYACSACRDRKLCSFYLEENKKSLWNVDDSTAKEMDLFYSHCQKYKCLENAENNIGFCNTCSSLVTNSDFKTHSKCGLLEHLSKQQIQFPSQILLPKSNSKCEAQYFFTEKSLEVIVKTLEGLQAEKLLCIGAPRVHEVIRDRSTLNIRSLLLDIDDRFCYFFPVEEYIVYNIFNHYFFTGSKSKEIYEKFLKGSEKIVLLTDPPFGGRMELIANTLCVIEKEWREVNNFTSDKILPVIFTFPYFSEKTIKSNLPSLSMLEYQVDYDNHPRYTTGPKGMKQGSAVRMFTNLSPHLFPFPEEEGYSLCRACNRWVHPRNVHCIKCGDCTSKDGRTYKHCDTCNVCVKPAWIHCRLCNRCFPKDHRCKASGGKARECSASKSSRKRSRKDGFNSSKKKLRKTPLPQNLKEEKERNLLILEKVVEGK